MTKMCVDYRIADGRLVLSLTREGRDAGTIVVLSDNRPLSVQPGTYHFDLLVLASAVYAIDRLVLRSAAHDAWSREIEVTLPVHAVTRWKNDVHSWETLLGFLTGDSWSLRFEKSGARKMDVQQVLADEPPRMMNLFSGGLDSLIGAIDWLASTPSGYLGLVGHHDPAMAGPKGEQRKLVAALESKYPGRLRLLQWRVGLGEQHGALETTFRSRSFLFIALLVTAAVEVGYEGIVRIPENGNIALNMPLTYSRAGSCSTRTAHPFYIERLNTLLSSLQIDLVVENPYEAVSKGQMVARCQDRTTLLETYKDSASCAKRGHTRAWVTRTAGSCGVCMPCIYRRASLHTIGADTEVVGIDLSAGQLKLTDGMAADLRAYLTLLSEKLTMEDVIERLTVSSPLSYQRVVDLAPSVHAAMQEVRVLVEDQGSQEMKRRAGLAD